MLSFNTTRIAEILGRVETLQTEESLFFLCSFPWLKNELMFAVVCVHLHQNRLGAEARACFASFSCLCQHEIREKACARALREPRRRGSSSGEVPGQRADPRAAAPPNTGL